MFPLYSAHLYTFQKTTLRVADGCYKSIFLFNIFYLIHLILYMLENNNILQK